MTRHLVVVSCGNHAYHGWQAQVATFSCLLRQRVAPLLVVHGAADAPLDPAFVAARAAGAWVLPSRDYGGEGERRWEARNAAASLLDAVPVAREAGATHLVLLDPDLVWVRRVAWPSCLAVDKACLDQLSEERAARVAGSLGLELVEGDACRWGARVPYVVPIEQAERLGELWWAAMDAYDAEPDRTWSDQMAAWSLAAKAAGDRPLRLTLTRTNWDYRAAPDAGLLHYAYETPYWCKRDHLGPGAELWDPPRLPVWSVQGWVCREIRLAGGFYRRLAGDEERTCA